MKKQSLDFKSLGDKHKMLEQLNQRCLIPDVPVIARLDGRAFHTLTRNAEKPFDNKIITAMQMTAIALLEEFHAEIAYVQSDEITLVWKKCDMFSGNIQKLVSTMASLASVRFYNGLRYTQYDTALIPTFDCRIWQVPSLEIAAENVMWREMDATRNSVSMMAHANFSTKELKMKNIKEQIAMLEGIGVFWNELDDVYKRGTYFKKVDVIRMMTEEEMKDIPEQYRPTAPVLRREVKVGKFPKATSIANFAEVLFDNAAPKFHIPKK